MSKVAIVYHSGYGHTKVQAEAVARGAASVEGTEVSLHEAGDFEGPNEDKEYGAAWQPLMEADAIIFGSPTYMGSPSAVLKQFFEHSSGAWYANAWKDKIAAGFTNSASQNGDKQNTIADIWTFAMQHMMVWVGMDVMPGNNHSGGSVDDVNRLGGFSGALAQSNADEGPDVAPPKADQDTAATLGARVARAAAQWNG